MGGQGKSQIALQYCHRKKTSLYPAIFWVDATTEDSTKRSFWAISEEIKNPTHVLSDIGARIDLVIRILSSWSIRWLLVFDNYDNPNAFQNIADFIPQNELGAIVVTSRHADSDLLVSNESSSAIKLHGLDRDDAILLLTQWGRTKDFELKDANEIVERLAYHPLAITQAGAYIKKAELQLSDFMKHYKKKREKILKTTPPLSQYRKRLDNNEEETSLNVFTTWELSFQQLEAQALGQNRYVKLLTLFAFLDNKDISEQLFAEFSTIDREDYPESAKLLTWLHAFTNGTTGEWDSDAFAEALITLKDLSLLQEFAQEPNGFYHVSLHPLIKDWIQLRTGKLIGQENTYMAATLVSGMISNSWRNNYFQLPLSTQQDILLHIVALQEVYRDYLIPSVEMHSNQDIFHEYIKLQDSITIFLSHRGSHQLAKILLEQIVAHNKEYLGLEHPETLTSAAVLALTYLNEGRPKEAEELGMQTLETRRRVVGLEHPATLTSAADLVLIYSKQGRFKEAEELEVQTLETRRKVLGLEHPETLTSADHLGFIYSNQGRLKEAESIGAHTLEARRRVLGLEHPDTLTSVDTLALMLLVVNLYR